MHVQMGHREGEGCVGSDKPVMEWAVLTILLKIWVVILSSRIHAIT